MQSGKNGGFTVRRIGGRHLVMSINPATCTAHVIEGAEMSMHMSLRLPWHDRGWDGHVCNNPTANVYCTGEFGLLAHEIRK
jgi:hypothetical protein